MAYLAFDSHGFPEFDERFGFFVGIGDGLFNEHVLAFFHGLARTIKMREGRGYNIHDIHRIHQCIDIIKTAIPEFIGNRLTVHGIGVIKTYQGIFFRSIEKAKVDLTQMSRPQYSNFEHSVYFHQK